MSTRLGVGYGKHLPFGVQEFVSADAAHEVMEAEGGGVRLPGGRYLTLEYSLQAPGAAAAGTGAAGHAMDWVCDRCRVTNFAR